MRMRKRGLNCRLAPRHAHAHPTSRRYHRMTEIKPPTIPPLNQAFPACCGFQQLTIFFFDLLDLLNDNGVRCDTPHLAEQLQCQRILPRARGACFLQYWASKSSLWASENFTRDLEPAASPLGSGIFALAPVPAPLLISE